MPRILVAGEALMDCIPLPDDAFRPIVGGSPFNVAVAAARLGRPAGTGIGFMSGVSTDFFGDRLMRALHAEGIDTAWVARLDAPTTLAFVDLSGPSPRYAFYDEKSATRSFTTHAIPELPGAARFVHVGSVSLIGAPGADEIAQMAHAAAAVGRVVCVDPNVRASLVANDPAWRPRINGLLEIASVVKLSDEDLETLEPGMAPADFAARTLAGGASLVIVTGGGAGAEAWTPTGHAHVTAPKIVVADTIGAGDTLMAATLVHLAEHGLDTRAAIASINESALRDLLGFATRAAAVTCTRAGCNPPLRHEV
jgi:fructokinase